MRTCIFDMPVYWGLEVPVQKLEPLGEGRVVKSFPSPFEGCSRG